MIITTINEVNSSVFERLMPEGFFSMLAMPGYFALGAIYEDNGEKYAAGTLVFEVTEGFNGEEDFIGAQLHWIYVAEQFRKKGIGDALMKEILRVLTASEIELFRCDLPMGAEYDFLCFYLEQWGFQFRLMDKYECDVTLEELAQNPFWKKKNKNRVEPLSEFSDNTVIQVIQQFEDTPYMPLDLEEALALCDKDVSCAVWEDGSIKGLLLLQKRGKESLDLLFARSLNQKPEHIIDLFLFAKQQLEKKYTKDTMIHLKCYTEAAAQLIAYLLPKAKPFLVRRGVFAVLEEEAE